MNVSNAYSQQSIWSVQELFRERTGQAQPEQSTKVSGDTATISLEAMELARNSVKPAGYGKTARDVAPTYDLANDFGIHIERDSDSALRGERYQELYQTKYELMPAAYVVTAPEIEAARHAIWDKMTVINDAYMRGEFDANEASRRNTALTATTPRLMDRRDYDYMTALDNTWDQVIDEMGLIVKPGEEVLEITPEQIKAVKEEASRRLKEAGFDKLLEYYGIQL